LIAKFRQRHPEMSVNRACSTLKLARSTYYYLQTPPAPAPRSRGRPITSKTFNIYQGTEVSDDIVVEEIEGILSRKFVLYGYKKVTAVLRRKGYAINHKKVYRLMRDSGLLLKEYPRKGHYRRAKRENEEPKAPNRKWSIDIKYGRAGNGERGYVIAVKDCFTKEIIACEVSRRHTAVEVERVLYLALANRDLRKLPVEELYVTSDNGREIIKAMKSLKKLGLIHCRITPRSPWENGEIESFFSCLEREVFRRFEIEDFESMRELVDEYVEFYNSERIHGGIGYRTPREKYLEHIGSHQEALSDVSLGVYSF